MNWRVWGTVLGAPKRFHPRIQISRRSRTNIHSAPTTDWTSQRTVYRATQMISPRRATNCRCSTTATADPTTTCREYPVACLANPTRRTSSTSSCAARTNGRCCPVTTIRGSSATDRTGTTNYRQYSRRGRREAALNSCNTKGAPSQSPMNAQRKWVNACGMVHLAMPLVQRSDAF